MNSIEANRNKRQEAANQEWLCYDLGHLESCGQGQWSEGPNKDTIIRNVYLLTGKNAVPCDAEFVVRFNPGESIVKNAYVDQDGVRIGSRGKERQAPAETNNSISRAETCRGPLWNPKPSYSRDEEGRWFVRDRCRNDGWQSGPHPNKEAAAKAFREEADKAFD